MAFILIGLAGFSVAEPLQQQKYQTLDWIALMPQDDLDALMNPPDFLLDIQDGSEQDSMESFGELSPDDLKSQRFQQALRSTQVVNTYDKKAIRLPGFIVPLQTNDAQLVTEFFIVPYFGACLHMPPPPPNQIIYAELDKGFALDNLYDAFWFEGVLSTEIKENELGASAYRMQLDNIMPYQDE
ncbi:DUF3299 domain-containing protein [uncultured Paraglaciecola sp.]|uniref:DUF3299 domain-containing protein n=1 Tax=uncultured Paraglaciecola sp. TaxID=1765024 RepID=UPI0030DCE406|tara:strand:- start:56287 stop:56838 length:552 start_codon:yes stop_codon:yes gene_type:complete